MPADSYGAHFPGMNTSSQQKLTTNLRRHPSIVVGTVPSPETVLLGETNLHPMPFFSQKLSWPVFKLNQSSF